MVHTYNGSRPLDNQVSESVATLTRQPLCKLPLVHEEGNFHLFGNGQTFITRLIVDENPGSTDSDIVAMYADDHTLESTAMPSSVSMARFTVSSCIRRLFETTGFAAVAACLVIDLSASG